MALAAWRHSSAPPPFPLLLEEREARAGLARQRQRAAPVQQNRIQCGRGSGSLRGLLKHKAWAGVITLLALPFAWLWLNCTISEAAVDQGLNFSIVTHIKLGIQFFIQILSVDSFKYIQICLHPCSFLTPFYYFSLNCALNMKN